MHAGLLLLLLLFPVTASQSAAQVEKLYPVDEGDRDASFFVFRARLLAAVAARDTSFVMHHVAHDVRTSFGPGGGIDDFRSTWRLGEPDSDLWPTLFQILTHGGAFSAADDTLDGRRRFVAPYAFAAFPEHLDAFTHQVVLGQGVRVRDAPGLRGRILATLSFDIVQISTDVDAGDEAPGWNQVVLADGRRGYVSAAYLASPLDYRVGFESRDGVWKIVFLVAGD